LLCEGSLVDEDATGGEVYVDGASNILTKPEFASTERMQELFRTLEEKSRLINILNGCVAGDYSPGEVKVVIGRENVAPSLQNCAVITTSYHVGDDISGTLGVVGPTRIEYARMMAVVNYLARFIERALSHEASHH
jgi:heat-inducible transcriptional repressor